jgi:hypothetical protein
VKCKFSRKTFQQPDLWVTYTDSDVRSNVQCDFHSPTTQWPISHLNIYVYIYGIFNISQPYRPPRRVTGIALLYHIHMCIYIHINGCIIIIYACPSVRVLELEKRSTFYEETWCDLPRFVNLNFPQWVTLVWRTREIMQRCPLICVPEIMYGRKHVKNLQDY